MGASQSNDCIGAMLEVPSYSKSMYSSHQLKREGGWLFRGDEMSHQLNLVLGPGKLPLCLCIKMPPKRPQICYFFAPKYAIVDKDVTFPRCDGM